MQQTIRGKLALAIFLMAAAPGLDQGCCQDLSAPVRVAMRPAVAHQQPRIAVGQLANITGGTSARRRQIAELDLAVWTDEAQSAEISQNEVLARLLLAGIQPSEFQITGPPRTRVQLAAPGAAVQEKLRTAIVRHVAQGLHLDQQDVEVMLVITPLQQNELSQRLSAGETQVRPLQHAEQLVGRRRIELGIFNHQGITSKVSVAAEVAIYRHVVVTTRPVEPGAAINEANSHVEKRRFESLDADLVTPGELTGQFARTRLRPQQLVKHGDLGRVRNAERNEPVIRSRDIVNVVAARGGMKITLRGAEALRSGEVGDVIPLRNPSSKEKIYGRVINNELVELVY